MFSCRQQFAGKVHGVWSRDRAWPTLRPNLLREPVPTTPLTPVTGRRSPKAQGPLLWAARLSTASTLMPRRAWTAGVANRVAWEHDTTTRAGRQSGRSKL
jgi:hypothetical protein